MKKANFKYVIFLLIFLLNGLSSFGTGSSVSGICTLQNPIHSTLEISDDVKVSAHTELFLSHVHEHLFIEVSETNESENDDESSSFRKVLKTQYALIATLINQHLTVSLASKENLLQFNYLTVAPSYGRHILFRSFRI